MSPRPHRLKPAPAPAVKVAPADDPSNPRWPVWIPTKGRWKRPLTIRMMEKLRVPHRVVVQPQERKWYEKVVGEHGTIVELPAGLDGLVPTRNWIWDRCAETGVERFWTFDDNIQNLYRRHQNRDWLMRDGTALRVIEEWAARWDNLAICGMQYFMFAPRRAKLPALTFNTRVYSNMLILTDARDREGRPYRNRGVYNDDTDLCLQVLRDGWCTALFYAFLAWKATTMTVKGGMTSLYVGREEDGEVRDGRMEMALELQRRWPKLVKVTRKWGRWQHHVDYSSFKGNRLRLRPGVQVQPGTNEFGMKLTRR